MTLVAKPRTPVMKSKFRLEIDGIEDIRATTVGPLKITFNIAEIDEGGAQTTVEQVINGYKYEPITVERPVTEDEGFSQWVDQFRKGIQDKRNGFLYALDTQGRDAYRWSLEEVIIVDYEEFAGDAKAKEESMMERLTLRYRERSKRETL